MERRVGTSPRWIRITPHPILDTSYRVDDLIDGNSYDFRVLAENKVGFSQPSQPSGGVMARDPWDRPSKPGSLRISDISKRSCRLDWSAPTSDGGDDIRAYSVEYRVAGAFKWVRANEMERSTDTHYKVTGLQDDVEYEFRVAAENRAGFGTYTESAMPVRYESPRGELTLLIAITE